PLRVLGGAPLVRESRATLEPMAPHGIAPLLPAISLVSWLFLGSESITVPAEEIKGSSAVIRRSAYTGFGIASVVYLLVAFAMMYGFPWTSLKGSASPLALAAEH